MKRLAAIGLGLWCVSAAAEAPFAPLPNVPDYVVTYAGKVAPGSPPRGIRIVTHHGGWARIDGMIDNQFRSKTFARLDDPLTITARQDSSRVSLSIRRGAEAHKSFGWDYDAFKTDEQDVILGEPCDVWNIGRSTISISPTTKSTAARFSCVSRDGIELRNWYSSHNSSGGATSIERRPVQANEVRPPADLFDLKSWLAEPAAPSSDPPSDAAVTMEIEQPRSDYLKVKSRIVRRHHPWTYTEDTHDDGRRSGSIINTSQWLEVSFEINPNGQFAKLDLSKLSPDPVHAMEKRHVDLGKQEAVLGMTCTWFDMMPGMMDAGHRRCQTQDGLVLKDYKGGRGFIRHLVATRIDRSPVALSEVSPEKMLMRGNWGLAD